MAGEEKPLLLCTAFPSAGHFNPVLAIAKHMARNGLFQVAFVMPIEFKESIERAGIEHIETPGLTAEIIAGFQQTAHLPANIDRMATQMGLIFFDTLAGRAKRFHEVLQWKISSRNSSKNIVLLEDALSLASAPYRYWETRPEVSSPDAAIGGIGNINKEAEEEENKTEPPLPAIGIGVSLLLVESEDAGPLLMGLPPDDTPSGKMRNRELHNLVRQGPGMQILQEKWKDMLQECGCLANTNAEGLPEFKIWNTGYEAYDVVYQLSVPSSEYPLSDLPANIQFAGTLPRENEEDRMEYSLPEWWEEVVGGEIQRKHRVIFISQGTINGVYDELIIPTMQAFADHSEVFMVATLGVRGASLQADVIVPGNARVVDYIPYDMMLAHTDVFVTNSGYGAFTHAIRNGVPIVAAGETEEKKEVALRISFSGAGVNLGTQHPSPDQVRAGVQKVLESPAYKLRAEDLMVESMRLNCLKTIDEKVRSYLT